MGKVYNLADYYVDNMSVARMTKVICSSQSNIKGTPRRPMNTIDNIQYKTLGIHYAGTEGLRRYIQELNEKKFKEGFISIIKDSKA